MKKILLILMAVLLLVSCSKGDEKVASTTTPDKESEQPKETKPVTENNQKTKEEQGYEDLLKQFDHLLQTEAPFPQEIVQSDYVDKIKKVYNPIHQFDHPFQIETYSIYITELSGQNPKTNFNISMTNSAESELDGVTMPAIQTQNLNLILNYPSDPKQVLEADAYLKLFEKPFQLYVNLLGLNQDNLKYYFESSRSTLKDGRYASFMYDWDIMDKDKSIPSYLTIIGDIGEGLPNKVGNEPFNGEQTVFELFLEKPEKTQVEGLFDLFSLVHQSAGQALDYQTMTTLNFERHFQNNYSHYFSVFRGKEAETNMLVNYAVRYTLSDPETLGEDQTVLDKVLDHYFNSLPNYKVDGEKQKTIKETFKQRMGQGTDEQISFSDHENVFFMVEKSEIYGYVQVTFSAWLDDQLNPIKNPN